MAAVMSAQDGSAVVEPDSVRATAPRGPIPALAVLLRMQVLLPSEEAPAWATYLPQMKIPQGEKQGMLAMHMTKTNSEPSSVVGRVWPLAQRQKGCRAVQDAIDICKTDQQRKTIADELKGHIWEAVRCPHANFVVQKLIVTLSPSASQFIIDEILARGARGVAQVSRHKFGCRIMQRLLEHCRHQQLTDVFDMLVQEALYMALHPFGNYVVQQLLEHGTNKHRSLVCHQLQQKAFDLGSDANGSAVLAKAMLYAPQEDAAAVARALTKEPGLLAAMARTRHGHVAVEQVMQLLHNGDLDRAVEEISREESLLWASRYGRLVLSSMRVNGHISLASAEFVRAMTC
eukprot:TRINITY_DN35632_c0_g1_i1.p1 TRINITY_DN35632_c0_g1~~TRINITY_DN35632_c0_g1_i1.p1  ORF type:complete len:345 (+),score=74.45 TRINITY_DN35632_c0_g1_i1:50-1084(+)